MLLHVAVGHTETLKRSWSDGQTNFGWHVAVKRESPRFIYGECQTCHLPLGTCHQVAEVAQLAEHQLPKLRVAGSNPVFRFFQVTGGRSQVTSE